jgi:tungstate transport system ATP-binding protein
VAQFVNAGAKIALEADGLSKSYAGREVVAVETLRVEEGEVFGILGPNGSGKSTLFRMLALIEASDRGEIRHFGQRVTTKDLKARRRVAAVFQRPLLFPGKVRANVAYGLRLHHLSRGEAAPRVERALGLVGGLDLADADVRTLSGGELQRVALARALVLEPAILFLDEPTSNLDVSVRRQFREDLKDIVRRVAATVILITHDQSEALVLADRVAIMREGGIVQSGSPDEVFAHPRDSFVADFMGIETIWRARVVSCDQGLCSVRTSAGITAELVAEAVEGSEVTVAVRPEDVALSVGDPAAVAGRTSVRNHWAGVVDSVTPAGPLVRVRVRLNPSEETRESFLVALVTRSSAAELGVAVGMAVLAGVKATAMHVLET